MEKGEFGFIATLPYPPSVNSMYATVGRRRILSAEGRRFKSTVATIMLAYRVKPIRGDIIVTGRIYRPRRCGDLSNRIKAAEDAMNGIGFVDDSQIVELHWYRYDDKDDPRCVISVTRLIGD